MKTLKYLILFPNNYFVNFTLFVKKKRLELCLSTQLNHFIHRHQNKSFHLKSCLSPSNASRTSVQVTLKLQLQKLFNYLFSF